jgi:hypothetical protein
MQPKLTIKSAPIDLELCELLGDKPADFIVLCFDGEQFESFGTPFDSEAARARMQSVVKSLNDKSAESRWPEMWQNWKSDIRKQYRLPDTTTSEDYRPVVSFQISRVCAGYSEHLHAAIGLFEKVEDKIIGWGVRKLSDGTSKVEIIAKTAAIFSQTGENMALTIARTVGELLGDKQANAELRHGGEEKL